MAAQSPEGARWTLRQLTEGHMTEQQRGHAIRLEMGMHAACMRSGPKGANCYRSKLHMMWVAHQAVLDWSMSRWATCRLAPFLAAPVVAGLAPHHTRRTKQRCLAPSSMNVFPWRAGWTRLITTPTGLQSTLCSSPRRGDQWLKWRPFRRSFWRKHPTTGTPSVSTHPGTRA